MPKGKGRSAVKRQVIGIVYGARVGGAWRGRGAFLALLERAILRVSGQLLGAALAAAHVRLCDLSHLECLPI